MKPTSSRGRDGRSLLIAAVMLLVATSVSAEPRSPQDWLRRMSEAMRSTNYAGVFIYRYGDHLEAMRIVHRSGADGERERLISLNGVAREIIRDDGKVTCIFPDSHAVMVDRRKVRNPLNNILPENTDALSGQYQLRVLGEGRVAGRNAVRIGIEPRDGYRYGYELAIDRELGLLLRSDLLADGQRPVEQIMFTEITSPVAIPDSWLDPTMSGDGFTWYRQEDDGEPVKTGASSWRVGTVPEGFRLTMQEQHSLPGRDVMVEHRLYTDGLASVSIYIERNGETGGAFHGRSRMGAINAFGRTLDEHQIVVVGEVPAVTVETIGRSISRSAEPGS